MSLFEEFPDSLSDKTKDKKSIDSSKKSNIPILTLRKGKGLSKAINDTINVVQTKLGKFAKEYVLLRTPEDLHTYCDTIIQNGLAALDTETSSLDPITTTLAGVCLYVPGQKAAYIPINHINYITNEKCENQIESTVVSKELQRCVDAGVKWVFHNAVFDIRVVRNQLGVNLSAYWDTQVAACLLNENESHRLKDLYVEYVDPEEQASLNFGELFNKVPAPLVPIDTFYLYSAGDPLKTWKLMEFQQVHLNEQKLPGCYYVYTQIELPIIPVIVDMEDCGISVDTEYAKTLSEKYNKLLEQKQYEVYKELDNYKDKIAAFRKSKSKTKLSDPINLSSPTQVAIVLYDILGLVVPGKDTKKKRSTDEKVISTFKVPFITKLLEYREIVKLVSTYIDSLPELINPKTGRIHCRLNQYGAKTGRFSSDSPNLQNVPSHNTDIRKMFQASERYVMISSDFSKQEPLILSQFCKDDAFTSAFTSGKDVYAEIGSLCFGVPYEQCLEFNPDGTTNKEGKERRSSAKTILLGTMYGRGANSVAQQIGKTEKEAQKIIDSFYSQFPNVKKWMDNTIINAKKYGYVETICGRKRRLPDIQLDPYEFHYKDSTVSCDPLDFTCLGDTEVDNSTKDKYLKRLEKSYGEDRRKIISSALTEGIVIVDNQGKIAQAVRQTVNARIQGSAADCSKKAMIMIHSDSKLQKMGCRLLIPVHDEVICECPQEYARECADRIAEVMVKAAATMVDIPMKCDTTISKVWYGEELKV